jgi:hypothetical protein
MFCVIQRGKEKKVKCVILILGPVGAFIEGTEAKLLVVYALYAACQSYFFCQLITINI